MTLKETQQGTMKKQLEDILLAISWRELASRYFEKSGSWLYHKLDGVDGNKKPTEFNEEERKQLKVALIDLSDRIRRAAAESIRANFSTAKMCEKTLALYRELHAEEGK